MLKINVNLQTEAEMIGSYNEWDPLEEVIVGHVDGACWPDWDLVESIPVSKELRHRVTRLRGHSSTRYITRLFIREKKMSIIPLQADLTELNIQPIRIIMSTGAGMGPTSMAAFDDALVQCGMYHNNLLHLSSMIPAGGIIEEGKLDSPHHEYGERRYVVMARRDENCVGHEAWAGLGWTQDQTGCGMFVEIIGNSEEQVQKDIHTTLEFMMERRNLKFGKIKSTLRGIQCVNDPVCALVIAFFPHRGQWT